MGHTPTASGHACCCAQRIEALHTTRFIFKDNRTMSALTLIGHIAA